jgi:hypothetical protein
MNESVFLRRREAGAYLREKFGFGSPATLAKLATLGGGPRFRKCGPLVLYSREDLDAWVDSRLSTLRASTSTAA